MLLLCTSLSFFFIGGYVLGGGGGLDNRKDSNIYVFSH